MKLDARAHLIVCVAWSMLGARAAAQEAVHAQVTRALAALGELIEVAREEQADWRWTEHRLLDEPYPLTVDIVAARDVAPTKVIYFFPGGGTNFHASFFIPHNDNLAHYFRERGYVVVGITPREDSVPSDVSDARFSRAWGMAKHRGDVRRVIETVQRALELPYAVLGHSYGGALALDYGAAFASELDRLIVLDIYKFDPRSQAQSVRSAQRTRAAYDQLLGLGTYLETMTLGSSTGNLSTWSDAERADDSGFARSLVSDYRGNFTNEGLYYYAQIETTTMPGLHSLFSGLKFDWRCGRATSPARTRCRTILAQTVTRSDMSTKIDSSPRQLQLAAAGSPRHSAATIGPQPPTAAAIRSHGRTSRARLSG